MSSEGSEGVDKVSSTGRFSSSPHDMSASPSPSSSSPSSSGLHLATTQALLQVKEFDIIPFIGLLGNVM